MKQPSYANMWAKCVLDAGMSECSGGTMRIRWCLISDVLTPRLASFFVNMEAPVFEILWPQADLHHTAVFTVHRHGFCPLLYTVNGNFCICLRAVFLYWLTSVVQSHQWLLFWKKNMLCYCIATEHIDPFCVFLSGCFVPIHTQRQITSKCAIRLMIKITMGNHIQVYDDQVEEYSGCPEQLGIHFCMYTKLNVLSL